MRKKYFDASREAYIDMEVKRCFKHPRKKKFTAIKGFNNSLSNLGYPYVQNQWLKKNGPIQLCKNGFHAVNPAWCPLAVFDFYSPWILLSGAAGISRGRKRPAKLSMLRSLWRVKQSISGSLVLTAGQRMESPSAICR